MLNRNPTVLVTGGCGFVGSALCRYLIANTSFHIVNIDKLTYAANQNSLASIAENKRYTFVEGDIGNTGLTTKIMTEHQVSGIFNLAAESHVDRSIQGPKPFIETNILGTYELLQSTLQYFKTLDDPLKLQFRFLHVSTDEVYGSLPINNGKFHEGTPYNPSSPYSASKAASDHLVRVWGKTYGLPILISNCSNNYGPCQFPEKLIPHMIIEALANKPLPVYGNGKNIRDWLHVEDHARALLTVFEGGIVGKSYTVGGESERCNIDVVKSICRILDDLKPIRNRSYQDQITMVEDRPGHDLRYAIDTNLIKTQLGWMPEQSFEAGLHKTVEWYLANENWWRPLLDRRAK